MAKIGVTPDAGSGEEHRIRTFGKMEFAGGCRDVDGVAGLEALVQMIGHEAGGGIARGGQCA